MDFMDPPELGPALLRWLQSFDFASTIRSWKDLQDGRILWQVLVDVEPSYFTGELPEDTSTLDSWIPRWQNLKHVNRLVMAFIRDECGKLQELSKSMNPDLKAMAIDASSKDSLELTKSVLLAALYSPESNQRMIQILDRLGTKTGVAIAQCISSMEQADHRLLEAVAAHQTDIDADFELVGSPERKVSQPRKHASRGSESAGPRDPQLEHEERLIRAHTRIKQLEEHGAGLAEELHHTRKDAESLEKDVKDLNYQLEHGRPGGVDDEALENLRQRSLQDKDNIAQLEMELAVARADVEGQEKQLDKLSRESEAYHKLQDELDLLRTERDELRQQSKANENLKKKIQTLQDSDKSNETLRQDLASLQQELQALRPLKQKFTTLLKANEENAKTIQNGEQEIFDQKTNRRRLEHELRMLTRQVDSAKERHRQDQELIREQEEKLRGLVPTTSNDETNEPASLNDEFASRDQAYTDMKVKNAQLEAEISKLREAQSRAGTEEQVASPDQSAYDLLKARCDKLEKQYLDVYQENLGLESGAEDSQPFAQMRDKVKEETEQRLAAEKKIFDFEAELAETKVKLQSLDAKYNSVGKDRDEALKELQHAASYENEILHAENTRLLDHLRTFEGDLEEHRSLLKHALLDKDAMLKQETDSRFADELKLITEQLRTVIDSPARTDDIAQQITHRIEESRKQAVVMETQVSEERQSREAKENEFKSRLKRVEEEAMKSAKSPDQAATQRELNLMTSAWYDLTRRMQSDAVVVQRRAEAPRSFLNRQRKLLNTTVIPMQKR